LRHPTPVPTVLTNANARFEVRFMTGMIDHHMMAVMMAEPCVGESELRAVCEDIVTADGGDRDDAGMARRLVPRVSAGLGSAVTRIPGNGARWRGNMTNSKFAGVAVSLALFALPAAPHGQSSPAQGQASSMKGHSSAMMESEGAKQLHQHMMKSAQEMRSMKMTGDVDHDFVTAMRMHHQDGIAIARIALEHGKDAKAREIAQRIIDEQQEDLKELDAWLSQHKP
jgi:uncharacterized protein (DUF305 family)